ncbi:hypothetical protein BJ170DRAFT_596404 [Xylariales sp. AK1849]|nr:hypothetical protein BJ170DRAFT_596404 [Xylariales sp. AK1849]
MSFGFSPSDLVMLLRGLGKLAAILSKDAVESFRRCAETYKSFSWLARSFDRFVVDHGLQQNSEFRQSRRDIESLLRSYFDEIDEFRALLGPKRVNKSLCGVIAKFRWTSLTRMLEQLRQNLDSRMIMLNTLVLITPSMPPGDHFILEDACGAIRLMEFSDISSWDHLHEFLLRTFSDQDNGHNLIQGGSYMLRSARTRRDILPSSPNVKHLREAIQLDDRIEMSMIFPYENSDTTTRSRLSFDLTERTSDTCALCVRFCDAFDDEPDPLTQLAMDDISESALGAFVEDFERDIIRKIPVHLNESDREWTNLFRRRFSDVMTLSSQSPPFELFGKGLVAVQLREALDSSGEPSSP